MMTDADRAVRILAQIADADDREWLAARMLAPWQQRAAHIERRAAALRAALAHYAHLSPTAAAKALARDLARRSACPHRLPGAPGSVPEALDRAIEANKGRLIQWRTIYSASMASGSLQKTPEEIANDNE